MEIITNLRLSGVHCSCFLLVTGLLLAGCGSGSKEVQTETKEEVEEGLVEILTTALDIQMPDTISSGWNTFKYENRSTMTHLITLAKYPVHDGQQLTVADAKRAVVPVFQAIMDSLNAGTEPPYGMLPEWFPNVQILGGLGLVGPQTTATSMVNMKPGIYVVECYVKNAGGIFHSAADMITGLVVTEDSTMKSSPMADVRISVSAEEGIQVLDEISSGEVTFEVNYRNQALQEHFLGFDVNLVKLEADTDTEALKSWMNWMLPEGLQIPAPARFMGGAQEMPGGFTMYFVADLVPGRYALIAEVPEPESKGMYREFEIPGQD